MKKIITAMVCFLSVGSSMQTIQAGFTADLINGKTCAIAVGTAAVVAGWKLYKLSDAVFPLAQQKYLTEVVGPKKAAGVQCATVSDQNSIEFFLHSEAAGHWRVDPNALWLCTTPYGGVRSVDSFSCLNSEAEAVVDGNRSAVIECSQSFVNEWNARPALGRDDLKGLLVKTLCDIAGDNTSRAIEMTVYFDQEFCPRYKDNIVDFFAATAGTASAYALSKIAGLYNIPLIGGLVLGLSAKKYMHACCNSPLGQQLLEEWRQGISRIRLEKIAPLKETLSYELFLNYASRSDQYRALFKAYADSLPVDHPFKQRYQAGAEGLVNDERFAATYWRR